ncbi:hypothetical protein [Streptomyces sp. SD31]|uniref:hypothetical protein n=1 Tax=Streptomyces sp. SD31 TaxID=3452208 RepID=UPI003F8893D7
MPNASRQRGVPRLRRLLALATGNWFARGYPAVVAASVLVTAIGCWAGWLLLCAFVNAAVLGALAAHGARAECTHLQRTRALPAPAADNWLVRPASPAEWASSPTWLSPLVFSAGAALACLFNAVLLGRLAPRLRVGEPRPAA